MKLVRARRNSDCAITAMASALGVDYEVAREALLRQKDNEFPGFSAGAMRRAARSLGFRFSETFGDTPRAGCRGVLLLAHPEDYDEEARGFLHAHAVAVDEKGCIYESSQPPWFPTRCGEPQYGRVSEVPSMYLRAFWSALPVKRENTWRQVLSGKWRALLGRFR